MIIVIPLNTDAPIYHFPRVTLGMIAINCFVFLITKLDASVMEVLQLNLGDGLHPLQWLTCSFVHYDIFHIIGNMVFLWGFGLVVEGKLGWWRYLLLYLGIGIAVGFVFQLISLSQSLGLQHAGGASAVISGLLGICLVWAPKNEVSCFLFIWFFLFVRATTFEMSILWYCGLFIFMDLLFVALTGFQLSGEFAHVMGAVIGLWIAFAMLKLKWVDCENWDLIAVINGTHGNPEVANEIKARRAARFKSAGSRPLDQIVEGAPPPDRELPQPLGARSKRDAVARIRRFLAEGKATAALAEYRSVKHFHPGWGLKEPELRALVNALFRAKVFKDVLPLMDEYIERFPGEADRIRLRRAGLAIQVEQRPRLAMRLIEAVSPTSLAEQDVELLNKIDRSARQLIAKGVLELGDVG